MISFSPTLHKLRRLLRAPDPDLEVAAIERWEIAPASRRWVSPSKFLPGQIERIRGAAFASLSHTVKVLEGGYESHEAPTLGFRFKDVDLVDGVLYASQAVKHLRPRARRLPAYVIPQNATSGALFESWNGNKWFGNWLTDDCLTYLLAEEFGDPVTTTLVAEGHVPQYEALYGMHPRRTARAHFDELTLFHDRSYNENKEKRARQLRERSGLHEKLDRHPGVFLLRGDTGQRRLLDNERSIAETVAAKRGFRVIDPSVATVEEIIAACVGAAVIAGVEGSHLVHGLMLMPLDATLFVIQPPYRVVSILKHSTDCRGQNYSFVVAQGSDEEFEISWDDVDRTLDLVLS